MNASVRKKNLSSATALRASAGAGRKERPATIEEMAALPFEAWKIGTGWTPPASGDEWAVQITESIATLQLAWATVHRSKPDLVAMNDRVDPKLMQSFIENIEAWQDYFQGMATILQTAEVRLMCAMAASIVESDKTKRGRRKAG